MLYLTQFEKPYSFIVFGNFSCSKKQQFASNFCITSKFYTIYNIFWSPSKFHTICKNCHHPSFIPYVKMLVKHQIYIVFNLFWSFSQFYTIHSLFGHPPSFIPYVITYLVTLQVYLHTKKNCKPLFNNNFHAIYK